MLYQLSYMGKSKFLSNFQIRTGDLTGDLPYGCSTNQAAWAKANFQATFKFELVTFHTDALPTKLHGQTLNSEKS
jgi:hypothetical protein